MNLEEYRKEFGWKSTNGTIVFTTLDRDQTDGWEGRGFTLVERIVYVSPWVDLAD